MLTTGDCSNQVVTIAIARRCFAATRYRLLQPMSCMELAATPPLDTEYTFSLVTSCCPGVPDQTRGLFDWGTKSQTGLEVGSTSRETADFILYTVTDT